MKLIVGILGLIAGTVFGLIVASLAISAELSYKFRVLDIKVSGELAKLRDISNRNRVLATAANKTILYDPATKARTVFTCPQFTGDPIWNTEGLSIANGGDVVGYCTTNGKGIGFLRRADGKFVFIDYPGAGQTYAAAISDYGTWVTGMFSELDQGAGGGFHCFLWNRSTRQFTRINIPFANVGTDIHCKAVAVNNAAQVLLEWVEEDAGNNYLARGWAIYDNGQFTNPFPPPPNLGDNTGHIPFDRTDDGMIIGLVSDGTAYQLFVEDDDQFFTVQKPANWSLGDLGGITKNGKFLGMTTVRVGVDQSCMDYYQDADYCAIEEVHGFSATPQTAVLAGQ